MIALTAMEEGEGGREREREGGRKGESSISNEHAEKSVKWHGFNKNPM